MSPQASMLKSVKPATYKGRFFKISALSHPWTHHDTLCSDCEWLSSKKIFAPLQIAHIQHQNLHKDISIWLI